MARRKKIRSDGRYQASLFLGYDEKGKVIRKYFYGESQREANAKKQQYIDGAELKKPREMSLGEWSDKWCEVYATGAVRNKANNSSILNKFVDAVGGDVTLDSIRPADIQRYAKTQAGFTKSHVDKVRRTLTNLFQTAVENEYIDQSPMRGIVWDSRKTLSHAVLEPYLQDLIRCYWKVHPAGKWALTMLFSGLRPSEAFALDWKNVTKDEIIVTDGSHFEHGKLVIVPGQVKSEAGQRVIPILPPLREALEPRQKEGLVCVNTKGEPVSEASARANWRTLWNMLEDIYNGVEPRGAGRRTDRLPSDWKYLPKVQMYDLRHTFCSMLYDADVDVKTAQYLMGHATLDMTLKIYTHLSEAKKKRSYDKLFKHFDVSIDVKNPENP